MGQRLDMVYHAPEGKGWYWYHPEDSYEYHHWTVLQVFYDKDYKPYVVIDGERHHPAMLTGTWGPEVGPPTDYVVPRPWTKLRPYRRT